MAVSRIMTSPSKSVEIASSFATTLVAIVSVTRLFSAVLLTRSTLSRRFLVLRHFDPTAFLVLFHRFREDFSPARVPAGGLYQSTRRAASQSGDIESGEHQTGFGPWLRQTASCGSKCPGILSKDVSEHCAQTMPTLNFSWFLQNKLCQPAPPCGITPKAALHPPWLSLVPPCPSCPLLPPVRVPHEFPTRGHALRLVALAVSCLRVSTRAGGGRMSRKASVQHGTSSALVALFGAWVRSVVSRLDQRLDWQCIGKTRSNARYPCCLSTQRWYASSASSVSMFSQLHVSLLRSLVSLSSLS